MAGQFWNDPRRQYLAQFDAPLIERVDLPDCPLREHAVLVESDQGAECLRRQAIGQNGVRRSITFKRSMWDKLLRCSFGTHLLGSLSERQRLSLREDVRHQEIVVIAQRIQRLAEADEVGRNQSRALMDQLIERVLTVRAWLALIDGSRLIVDARSVTPHVFAVALHRELLQVRRQALEVLLIRQNGNG